MGLDNVFSFFGPRKAKDNSSIGLKSDFGIGIENKQRIPSATEQAEIMTKKVADHSAKLKRRLRTHELTMSLNKSLTKSFMNNTAIIISVSQLLAKYKTLFSTLQAVVTQYTNIDIKAEDMEHLKILTTDQMSKLKDTFSQQSKEVMEIFESIKDTSSVERIKNANSVLNDIELKARAIEESVPKEDRAVPASLPVGGKSKNPKKTRKTLKSKKALKGKPR